MRNIFKIFWYLPNINVLRLGHDLIFIIIRVFQLNKHLFLLSTKHVLWKQAAIWRLRLPHYKQNPGKNGNLHSAHQHQHHSMRIDVLWRVNCALCNNCIRNVPLLFARKNCSLFGRQNCFPCNNCMRNILLLFGRKNSTLCSNSNAIWAKRTVVHCEEQRNMVWNEKRNKFFLMQLLQK